MNDRSPWAAPTAHIGDRISRRGVGASGLGTIVGETADGWLRIRYDHSDPDDDPSYAEPHKVIRVSGAGLPATYEHDLIRGGLFNNANSKPQAFQRWLDGDPTVVYPVPDDPMPPPPAGKVKTAVTSALKNAGNQAGHWRGRLGVLWHQQTQPKVRVNDRRTGHSAACNAKRGNRPGGPGFIRTAGCPGCAKLGKKPATKKGKGKR